MAVGQRSRFISGVLTWTLANLFVLVVTGWLTYELFFVVSLIGFLVVVELTSPVHAQPLWRRRLRWTISSESADSSSYSLGGRSPFFHRRCSKTMQLRGHELTYPHLLFAIVILITVGVCIAALRTSTATFGAYNHDWDGASDLRSLAAGSDRGSGSSIERGIPRGGSGTGDRVRTQSNSVVHRIRGAGDFGVSRTGEQSSSRPIADRRRISCSQPLDVDSRFDGQQLRDEQRYYRSPALPVASPAHESPVTRNISQITLNHGTAVAPSENADALVNSSSFSYLDSNSNAELDSSEPIHQYPLSFERMSPTGA